MELGSVDNVFGLGSPPPPKPRPRKPSGDPQLVDPFASFASRSKPESAPVRPVIKIKRPTDRLGF